MWTKSKIMNEIQSAGFKNVEHQEGNYYDADGTEVQATIEDGNLRLHFLRGEDWIEF